MDSHKMGQMTLLTMPSEVGQNMLTRLTGDEIHAGNVINHGVVNVL
jgi:hypothetical protein